MRLIHSVESESVLRQLERTPAGRRAVLLEVNVAGEQSKTASRRTPSTPSSRRAAAYPKVRFAGLMTMPPAGRPTPRRPGPTSRPCASWPQRLRRDWAPEHAFEVLSMGTSQDFEVAVEEGATVVRLGSVLYA